MIKIKHRETGKVLHTVDADTLKAANLINLDLSEADLMGRDLRESDLRDTDLSGAIMCDCDLSNADLRGSALIKTNFTDADFYRADLSNTEAHGANFSGATLNYTTLVEANLSQANLRFADLHGARLNDAFLVETDLTNATCSETEFINTSTLRHAIGLETIVHGGASHLDALTLRTCVNDLPSVFLRGVGYNDEEIETLRAMYKPGGIAYFSCFLSSAEADLPFVTRLHNDLQANSVTCWHYKENMRGGLDWKPQINDAIKFHDKLVLVCSRRSVYRENVVHEIIQAIDSERETGNQKLFPIRLDNHIFSDAMMEEAREMVLTSRWRENWVVHIKRKHIPDFSTWEKSVAYQKELRNLLRDLKQSVPVT